MNKVLLLLFSILSTISAFAQSTKAPSYPLITHDPYFSIWSNTDELMKSPTQHWTGVEHSLTGMIEVDGQVYRFLGQPSDHFESVLPASDVANFEAQYTEAEPATDWVNESFNDSQWIKGIAPFGSNQKTAKTLWTSRHLWVRRSFDLPSLNLEELFLKLKHDDNIWVYLNGHLIYEKGCCAARYDFLALNKELKTHLKLGKNLLAFHVENTGGNSHFDVGIVERVTPKNAASIREGIQKSVQLNATQTLYNFECGKVNLSLTFTSPLLMADLNVLARPVSYISAKVKANDGKNHPVKIYLGVSSDIAVNASGQEVNGQKYQKNQLSILKAGTIEQAILQKKGDDIRIDWGYLYVATPTAPNVRQSITNTQPSNPFEVIEKDISTGKHLSLNTIADLGEISPSEKEQLFLIGYDDLYAVQYFNTNLRPWWNHDGKNNIDLQLASAAKDYKAVIKKCEALNRKIYQDAFKAGGENYAKLCELAYRQSIAAHKLVKSPEGEILFLSKENFSNGSINTVDVTYPSAPLFLAYNPDLLKGMLNGIFYYSESGRFTKPFAAHDLGTYPLANGQTYPHDMPVEESGNMIILTAAICKAEGNIIYAKKHWKTLSIWADYLSKEGFDPANQLCTDDFAGHLAHNINLSAKAIVALACFGEMAEKMGEQTTAQQYKAMAKAFAAKWTLMGKDGDHYALAFDKKGTWSQKYNLVWDKILQLNLFDREVYDTEIKYYLTQQNEYGLPLDSRESYTKSDWVIWTSVLANDKASFEALVNPMFHFATTTQSRVPLTDWHWTKTGLKRGFQARSVVAGYYMKVLEHKMKEIKPKIQK